MSQQTPEIAEHISVVLDTKNVPPDVLLKVSALHIAPTANEISLMEPEGTIQ